MFYVRVPQAILIPNVFLLTRWVWQTVGYATLLMHQIFYSVCSSQQCDLHKQDVYATLVHKYIHVDEDKKSQLPE